MADKTMLSVSEMAKLFGISKPTAYELVKTEGFPLLQVGKRKLIPIKALDKWIEENTNKGAIING